MIELTTPLSCLYALGLALGLLTLAGAAGNNVLRRLLLDESEPAEKLLYETNIGLGIVAYGVLAFILSELPIDISNIRREPHSFSPNDDHEKITPDN